MQVLVDTSVVLDVLLRREPWFTESSVIWQAIDDNLVTGWLTASSFTDIFYIVRRLSNLQIAQNSVQLCLKTFAVCTVDRMTLEEAAALSGKDFEDNLQIACASLTHLDAIITRDEKGFLDSPVPVFSPAELIARLNSSEE